MCGIAGGWYPGGGEGEDRVDAALEALSHRGPDASGKACWDWPAGRLSLGHRRLSIIDLSDAANQPMSTTDGRFVLVFNGEIYNYRELASELRGAGYRFKTNSDTEVLLAAWQTWGRASLPRFRGMFSFAVLDRERGELICARDAFGVKPLFFAYQAGSFVFASELPAVWRLLRHSVVLNLKVVHEYLVDGMYDHTSETFIQDVFSLEPGHLLTIRLGAEDQPTIQRWWWPSVDERTDRTFELAVDEFRNLFLDSVRLHLRSDVPVAAALSGGLDSSAVTCAIRHIEPDFPLHTFTYVARNSPVDEEHYADLVVSRTGAVAHKVVVTPQELRDDIDDMIRAQGEPFGSTSIYAQYRVFKAARESGMTVVLDGQGADELLAGYHGYPGSRLLSLIDRRDFAGVLRFLRQWSKWPGRSIPRGVWALLELEAPEVARQAVRRWTGRDYARTWFEPDALALSAGALPPSDPDVPQRRLAAELRRSLTGGGGLAALLRHADRNSMRWSIESRVPFLSTEIAEYVLRLPESFLLSMDGETKHIFRVAMDGLVPPQITQRRDKVGFATPEHGWLRGLDRQVLQWLEPIDELPFLNSEAVRRDVTAVLEGRRRWDFRIWRIINLARWLNMLDSEDVRIEAQATPRL